MGTAIFWIVLTFSNASSSQWLGRHSMTVDQCTATMQSCYANPAGCGVPAPTPPVTVVADFVCMALTTPSPTPTATPTQWVAGIATGILGWIVTIATTRRQLLDHIKECDRRYNEAAGRLAVIEADQKEVLRYLRNGRGPEPGH